MAPPVKSSASKRGDKPRTAGFWNRVREAPRWAQIVLPIVLVLFLIAAITGGGKKPPPKSQATSSVTAATKTPQPTTTAPAATTTTPQPTTNTTPAADQTAVSYIQQHGDDAKRVRAMVQSVQVSVGLLQQTQTQANLNQVAQTAQTVHDNIDAIRNNFAATDSGALGDDEADVFAAAEALKNAMGALVAYTGTPNPATLASFRSQYAPAIAQWNRGVQGIWGLARESNPPTL